MIHKPIRRHFKRNRVIVGGIDQQWQMDLADMQSMQKCNDGYRYLLVCIDVFSKYAWVVPLKKIRRVFCWSKPSKSFWLAVIMSSVDGADYKVKLTEVYLKICKVKASPSISIAHKLALKKGPAIYPVRRVECKTFIIPTGNQHSKYGVTQQNKSSKVFLKHFTF